MYCSHIVPCRRRTLALVLLLEGLQRRARGRRSRFWVHPLNQKRRQQGDFHHLVAELRLDSQRHHQYFRMSAEQMDKLLSLVIGPEVTRQSTNYRAAIEPKQRLKSDHKLKKHFLILFQHINVINKYIK